MPCPKNSHYKLCGTRCPVVCAGLSSPANCSGGCEEGCQCDTGYVLSDGQCVLVSDCGCMHEGQYHPAGHFNSEKSCQKCNCKRGEVTCSPMESCSVKDGLVLQYGVCQVFAGFGYITFDGVILPHHGACTYVVSALSSKAIHDYSLLLSFKKDSNGIFTISRLVFHLLSLKVSVNGEERSVPFDNGELEAYQVGDRLIIITPSGVGIDLSSTQYLRLTVPQVYDATASGLCGNFNGDKYDDLKLRNGHLTESFAELLHSWAVVTPGQHFTDICGKECDDCSLSSHESMLCDVLLDSSIEFNHCWNSGIERDIYRVMCIRAVCAGAGHVAACLALEAYSAACQAKGIPVGSWRENTPCCNSPRECVDSSSNSCPALLQPGSSATGCSEGCQCSYGNVFDGNQCVPYSQCGCVLNDIYIKMDERLYTDGCAKICWCHTLGGVICEEAVCNPGQQCALRNGSWVSLSCSSITCSASEVCEMKGGYPSCVPKPVESKPGTCWAMGDPHYRTFDGRHYNFMGTCTYVIAKNCGKDDLPAFEILAQNENRGSLRVSYVALVTVKVYGITITVVRSETGRVRVRLSVCKGFGHSVVIETDFGLTVRYDWEHYLVVTLSSSYAGKTCGLCGNFNGSPNDDFTTPSGTQADGAVAFGSSWKVPGLVKDDRCRDDCVGGCERCEHSLMKMWEGDLFCGLIIRIVNGPFSKCHAIIDPQAYLENCKYDVCMGGGLRHFLCNALEAYTEACQLAGIQVQDWRKMAKCLECPANSHYEHCGNACPATCSDPDAPSKCKRPCVMTCTCNAGFVWSGGQCVPAAQCGCTYEGRYIPAGESFWADQGCQKWCKCIAGSRLVECQNKGCGAGQQCKVVDGIRKCQALSYSTCQATGDPHYMTFDKTRFDFQGTCVYQLVALCSNNPELVPFEVLVQNDHRGSKVVSYTKLVEVKVYSLSIVITRTHKGLIMVNNELVNLPVTLAGGQVSVYKSGWYALLTTNFGLEVSFNWENAVFVTLPSNYMGAVCGLCGNYNGKGQDDLIPKNGDKAVSPAAVGASWRVAEIPGCVEGCKRACPDCDITQKVQYEKGDFCGILRDPNGPFRGCHAKVDPAGYFKDCVYDVCLYKGRKDVLCQAITSYTSACQAAGAKVYSWRTSQLCAVKCPVNSHYEVCATGCPATCKSLAPLSGCKVQCKEGCSCDDGYILSGDVCVPFSQCGCLYNDRYYRIGQVFYPNGQCQEECKCTQDGEVECQKFSCGPNENCKVENGVQKCHPVGKGVCHASGDPHYRSFDGRLFDFQGTCTYTLSKSCGLEGTHLVAFSVEVENVQWNQMVNNKVVSVTKLVAVKVYGFTLIMRNNMFGVLVNGVFNYLPVNLDNGAVLVYQEGQHYVIATNFGLLVTYDLVYHVTVTVPGNYRGKVCGLCGNFNGNQKDDFQTPKRQLTSNVNVFGTSWKVTIPGVVCKNGCEGNYCPKCEPARKAVFSKSTYCGVVTAPKGPFAVCHSKLDPEPYFEDCVFDVCASNGDGKVLCNSIAAYAFNCHMAGVDVKNWRTASFCPMKCPANSHYEVCADACSASCPGLTEIVQCSTSCTEGCECDDGFLFNGQICVKETECGCYDNGKTYRVKFNTSVQKSHFINCYVQQIAF
uniref:Fc gamma binding protein n=1 Tax=Seriola lalandi dorsalis TaxID=1841481 RepID=A0A3B4Y5L9_SERLL